jgi:uncharacterized membrane protein
MPIAISCCSAKAPVMFTDYALLIILIAFVIGVAFVIGIVQFHNSHHERNARNARNAQRRRERAAAGESLSADRAFHAGAARGPVHR